MLASAGSPVLNSQGVRFGSSEIYTVVEDIEEVEDCLVVAQKTPDADERVVLFVKPLKGSLDSTLRDKIKNNLKTRLSSRHVPAVMIELEKIPYTTNGKRLEVSARNTCRIRVRIVVNINIALLQIPVKKLVNGTAWEALNLSSAEDPEYLKVFVKHPELRLPVNSKAKL